MEAGERLRSSWRKEMSSARQTGTRACCQLMLRPPAPIKSGEVLPGVRLRRPECKLKGALQSYCDEAECVVPYGSAGPMFPVAQASFSRTAASELRSESASVKIRIKVFKNSDCGSEKTGAEPQKSARNK